MSEKLRPERITQDCVVFPYSDSNRLNGLGYSHLGDWSKRASHRVLKQGMMQVLLTGRTRLV